jgi:hypothetical protein
MGGKNPRASPYSGVRKSTSERLVLAPMFKLRAGRLALLFTSIFALLAVSAGIASAAEPKADESPSQEAAKLQDKMTFIGDSVTAGFGYCGTDEPKSVTCGANGEMENNWEGGDTSLKKCAPKDAPAVPDDVCSNNNVDGKPWTAEPWKAGHNAPDVAYPFQIAKRQNGPDKAEISDWAVTGSTPADWDPNSGEFGGHLDQLKNQYVGMTVGANPLLSYFTSIKFAWSKKANGPCVDETGQPEASGWFFQTVDMYSGPISKAVDCLKQHWNKIDQTQHLVNIYTKLLSQNDRVVVMGYYRDCSWSFGNWQPQINLIAGPARGYDCKSEKREVSTKDSRIVTQWDQATAVGAELNNLIQDAVMKAKEQAKERWPDTNRDDNLVYTQPDNAEWEQHQPKSDKGSWILLNDTWIHPNKAGAGNLATTVEEAMCSHFDHWCGGDHEWNAKGEN